MKNFINLIVDQINNGMRVDLFLTKKNPEISRSRIKNLILKKKLKLNNNVLEDPSKKVIAGDKVLLEIPEPEKTSLKPFNYKLDIFYEDEDLIVINKPAGIAMHPGAGDYDKTLVNALIHYQGSNLSTIGDELRPGIVHRIDKETSGLVVVAKNNITHENLSNQFRDHSITRVYHCLIWGKLRPQSGRIETLITRSSKNRQLMEVGINKGKRAITNYRTIELFENEKIPTLSYVECILETGRTHQIRVHMHHKGNSIVGDKKYKKRFKKLKNIDPNLEKLIANLERQFLLAQKLGFMHPTNNEYLEFSSDLSPDLEILLKKLRNLGK